MTRTRPPRRMTLHLAHIFLTEARTFMMSSAVVRTHDIRFCPWSDRMVRTQQSRGLLLGFGYSACEFAPIYDRERHGRSQASHETSNWEGIQSPHHEFEARPFSHRVVSHSLPLRFSSPPSVTTTTPPSVSTTVCSKCTDNPPDPVTTVHRSS